MWWIWPSKPTEIPKSDWEKVQDHARNAYTEIDAGWTHVIKRCQVINEHFLPKELADKTDKVFQGIPWACLGLTCPTVLIVPAIATYVLIKAQYGPFSEQSTKNACNGIGVACGVSALTQMAHISNPLYLVSATVYGLASYHLLSQGGLLSIRS